MYLVCIYIVICILFTALSHNLLFVIYMYISLHVSPAALSMSDVYQPAGLTIDTFKKHRHPENFSRRVEALIFP